MNLLELNKQIKEKISNKEKIDKELENYKEIKRIIFEISIGSEKYSTNNKELFDEIGIKLKTKSTSMHFSWYKQEQKYEFKLNKTNIAKIQKYIDRENKDE